MEIKKNDGQHKHNSFKHLLHMALCCGLPMIIIVALPLISRFSPGAGRLLGVIAPFICPIMMLSMLPMLLGGKKKGSCCDNRNNEQNSNVPMDRSLE